VVVDVVVVGAGVVVVDVVVDVDVVVVVVDVVVAGCVVVVEVVGDSVVPVVVVGEAVVLVVVVGGSGVGVVGSAQPAGVHANGGVQHVSPQQGVEQHPPAAQQCSPAAQQGHSGSDGQSRPIGQQCSSAKQMDPCGQHSLPQHWSGVAQHSRPQTVWPGLQQRPRAVHNPGQASHGSGGSVVGGGGAVVTGGGGGGIVGRVRLVLASAESAVDAVTAPPIPRRLLISTRRDAPLAKRRVTRSKDFSSMAVSRSR
jgi:hypothetical protein